MGIFETYTKRQKRLENAGKQDVYQYDQLPHPCQVQVIHIWNSAIGVYYVHQRYTYTSGEDSPANQFWKLIHETRARELGLFTLTGKAGNPDEQCKQFLLTADTGGALDIIELSFRSIDRGVRKLASWQVQKAGFHNQLMMPS